MNLLCMCNFRIMFIYNSPLPGKIVIVYSFKNTFREIHMESYFLINI